MLALLAGKPSYSLCRHSRLLSTLLPALEVRGCSAQSPWSSSRSKLAVSQWYTPCVPLQSQLREVLGERVSTKPAVLQKHGEDESYHPSVPPQVCRGKWGERTGGAASWGGGRGRSGSSRRYWSVQAPTGWPTVL